MMNINKTNAFLWIAFAAVLAGLLFLNAYTLEFTHGHYNAFSVLFI